MFFCCFSSGTRYVLCVKRHGKGYWVCTSESRSAATIMNNSFLDCIRIHKSSPLYKEGKTKNKSNFEWLKFRTEFISWNWENTTLSVSRSITWRLKLWRTTAVVRSVNSGYQTRSNIFTEISSITSSRNAWGQMNTLYATRTSRVSYSH